MFCRIINGEIATDFVYQDEEIVVFKDINPKAPVHLLIVPKKHLENLNDVEEIDQPLLGKVLLTAKKMANLEGIDKTGFRLLVNNGSDAGQIINHLHFHLLGGKKLDF